jgi:2'-5' RNA ligase
MSEQSPIMRAFIAVELPEALKLELSDLQKHLWVKPATGIKWVAPDGIHLTLKFLGWVPIDRIEAIKTAIDSAVTGLTPFKLELSVLGAFPNLRRMNVVWCGLSGDLDQLTGLQQSIENHISPLGFPTENRGFSPHLTLARLKDEVSVEVKHKLADKIAKTKIDHNYPITVNSVSLMQSTLFPSGAVYTQLGNSRLIRS